MRSIAVKPLAAAVAVGCMFAGAASTTVAQQTINMTLASSHPTTFLPVGVMAGFFKSEVDRLLKDGGNKFRINWKEAYAGTLYKLQDTMEAVRDGITDIGYVGSVWESDTMPLSNVTFFAPFVTGDLNVAIGAVDKMAREIPALQKEWVGNNMMYLGGMGIETYHLWTKTPVLKFEDLKGKRYNAPATALQWIRNTGAVGVDGGLPVYYTNVQTGVVDGAISFYTGIFPMRLHEVAPHVTEVDIGAQYGGGVAITLDRFKKLPKEVQDALVQAGRAYPAELIKQTAGRIETSKKAMLDAGAKVARLSEEDRRKWAANLPDVAGEWVKQNEAKGLPARQVLKAFMDEARKAGAKPLRDWDKSGSM
jgi:TRAP-type C4-dicarboxylate transport system substrate-binding protein